MSCLTLPAALIIASVVIAGTQSASTTIRVLELACGGTPLTDNGHCKTIAATGEDEFVINPTAQKVWWGYPGGYSEPIKGCEVVDIENWECKDQPLHDAGIDDVLIHAMRHGHYTRSYVGHPPDGYFASLTGWRRLIVKFGLMTAEQAQQFE